MTRIGRSIPSRKVERPTITGKCRECDRTFTAYADTYTAGLCAVCLSALPRDALKRIEREAKAIRKAGIA